MVILVVSCLDLVIIVILKQHLIWDALCTKGHNACQEIYSVDKR